MFLACFTHRSREAFGSNKGWPCDDPRLLIYVVYNWWRGRGVGRGGEGGSHGALEFEAADFLGLISTSL